MEFLFLPSSRVSAFLTRRCDNHSTRWTIIDRRLFTLALTRLPLCVSYLQRFSEKTPVIDRVLTRKWLFFFLMARDIASMKISIRVNILGTKHENGIICSMEFPSIFAIKVKFYRNLLQFYALNSCTHVLYIFCIFFVCCNIFT